MATLRQRPYVQFNFLVDLGTGVTAGPQAGFQEVSGIGMEVTVAEYRPCNHKENSVMKITGMNKSTDVTLKRGVIDSDALDGWLNEARKGTPGAYSSLIVEERGDAQPAKPWRFKLEGTRIVNYTGGSLNAKGADVAIEELVLSCEQLELE